MLTVFGTVAEPEREYILQRKREGMDIAKANGIYKGRKPIEPPGFSQVVARCRRGGGHSGSCDETVGDEQGDILQED